jgi:hypothetical protein
LAPTVGIAATGFCYPGGILKKNSSTKSANFAAADSSQIASCRIIFIGGKHQQSSTSTKADFAAGLFVSRLSSGNFLISQAARGRVTGNSSSYQSLQIKPQCDRRTSVRRGRFTNKPFVNG